MDNGRSAIAEDLERQLTQHLQQDLNRRLNLYVDVVGHPEIALMLTNIATSMFLGAQTFALTHLRDGADGEEMLRAMEAMLFQRVHANRSKVCGTADALRRGKTVDGAVGGMA